MQRYSLHGHVFLMYRFCRAVNDIIVCFRFDLFAPTAGYALIIIEKFVS